MGGCTGDGAGADDFEAVGAEEGHFDGERVEGREGWSTRRGCVVSWWAVRRVVLGRSGKNGMIVVCERVKEL